MAEGQRAEGSQLVGRRFSVEVYIGLRYKLLGGVAMMQTILMVAGAIGLIVGSLMAAALLCWLLWDAFRLVLHPELTALVVLMILVLAVMGKLPNSQFLHMVVAFAVVAAIPLWIAGRAWRKQHLHDVGCPRGHRVSRGTR